MSPNLNIILWYHDRIEIDTSFSVMAVAPQTPKCHHNLRCTSVVVTFGNLWCDSHDLKLSTNSFNNVYQLFELGCSDKAVKAGFSQQSLGLAIPNFRNCYQLLRIIYISSAEICNTNFWWWLE